MLRVRYGGIRYTDCVLYQNILNVTFKPPVFCAADRITIYLAGMVVRGKNL